ncbi:DNA ligase D [Sphingobium aromaticiconvertens]|uniref:DNA ligase D n=1 Tax=Sphingobium aromaticiconvertens TaxID=365341 RepID=UPI003019B2F0
MARPDPLADYNRKRDFAKTKEPVGKIAPGKGNLFIVQKHDATRLHYDFRLEVDGVLKSWAVTRGPSRDPEDKRLAVRTEDHPMSYAGFEGAIPKGEYGGGTVMLWDEGLWTPVPGKNARDLDKGHLHFTLQGERMKGEWLLIRLKPRAGEKRENWLLRKIADGEAGSGDELVERALTSVKTGRTMAQIAAQAPAISLKGKRGKAFDKAMDQAVAAQPRKAKAPARRAAALPAFRKPQLATLVDGVPTGNGWLHEIKYDGYRCLLSVAGNKAKVHTRTGLDWTQKFPDITAEARQMDLPPALIDGEIVALDDDGNPDFSRLQKILKGERKGALHLFAFDLLDLDGDDLTGLSTIERKERLAALLREGSDRIHVADHVVGAGERLFQAMCDAGQEGILSKRADAPYHGVRSKNWLKVKCTRREEFIIVGWLPSSTRGRAIRSLLLGQYRDGSLVYAGKVGTGFDADTIDMLMRKLKRLERKTATVAAPSTQTRSVHWVSATLVAEIAYAEYTGDHVLRHASFLGLRDDKAADAVQKEDAMAVPDPTESDIVISNRDRLIFPEAKVSKGDLADYYAKVGSIMLPWVVNRPISLVRCPQGRAKKCFFQKHDSGSFGDHVRHVPIREKDGGQEDYLYVCDIDGLVACVQMGTIEFHGWGSRVADVERPDRLIFDLDPDEGLDFTDVRKAAADIHQMLDDVGLVSFAMLSGGKGVHVVVPLKPDAQWPQVKDFSSRFANALAQAEPDRFVATMSKAKRKGKIFIDWLRNQRGSTAILPYSVRAREQAPVAAPVSWNELRDVDRANLYTIRDADALLERASTGDLARWGIADQMLPDI